MKCTACDEDCEATFVCDVCHIKKQVCASLPGGFTDKARTTCVTCYEEDNIDFYELLRIRRREYEAKNRARRLHRRTLNDE
jgi:hypothetical protein